MPLPEGGRVALVLGNELNGVSDAVIAACDGCVVIPQAGSKHSLNVSVCAGVVAWWVAGRGFGV
jgi:23S rRNA (guanosine2251-2'-O)-methyltransferase